MAKFFQTAQKAYNDTEDRIYQKRKQNREDFLSYRKMKAEMGEDVTADELQEMRRSIAGSDAFFLNQLPPGQMMSQLADRTNDRARATRRKEDADEVARLEKENGLFDNFVGYNLDAGDITDQQVLNKMEQDFIKGFPDNPELGRRLWDANSRRLADVFNTKQNEAVTNYADTQLKNVTSVADAESIMDAQNVASWKKDAVKQVIQRRQNDRDSAAIAAADKGVVNYDGKKLRFLDDDAIGNVATEIIKGAEVQLDPGSEEYKALHARLKASLLLRQQQADASQADVDKRAFDEAMNSAENPFVRTVLAQGFDDQDLLDAYNLQAKRYNQPLAETVDDDNFQFWKEVAERTEGIEYQERYKEADNKAEAVASAALEKAKASINAIANSPLLPEGSAGRYAIDYLVQTGYVFMGEPSQVLQMMAEQFGEDGLANADQAVGDQIVSFLKAQGAAVQESTFKQSVKAKNHSLVIPPGTNIDTYVVEELADYKSEMIPNEIANMLASLKLGASDAEVEAAHQKLRDYLALYIEKDIQVAVNSRGAFRGADIGTPLEKMKNDVLDALELELLKPENRRPRPQTLPSGLFVFSGGNKYVAQNGAGQYTDIDGNPVIVGRTYEFTPDKQLRLVGSGPSSTQQLPQVYLPGQRSTFGYRVPAPAMAALGDQIAAVTDRTSTIAGFTPDPTYGYRAGGPFDTRADWVASIVKQMAKAYREQGEDITDRELYKALGSPLSGSRRHGLNASFFDDDKRTP